MAGEDQMKRFFAFVDEHKEEYIKNLGDAVEIKSVSAWPQTRGEIVKMVELVGDRVKALGGTIEYCDVGMQTLPDGSKLKLPPVLMGHLGSDPNKKTLLIYISSPSKTYILLISIVNNIPYILN